MVVEEFPFSEDSESNGEVIRTFVESVDESELIWHRDREDRIVDAIGESDWLIQIDNELPRPIKGVYIPKGVYHRVLKGSGDLKVRIKKKNI